MRSLGGMAILAAALAAVTADPGVAQARWRLDVQGGAFVPAGDARFGEGTTTVDVSTDVGGSFGVGGSYGVGDWLDLGGHYQRSFSGLDLGVISNSLKVGSLTAGARAYLAPPGRFRPWLACEIGWYRARADFDVPFGVTVESTEDSFGVNAGGGADFAVTDLVSLGVDVRYHNAVDAFGGLGFVTTMFNVGFHFDGEAADRGTP